MKKFDLQDCDTGEFPLCNEATQRVRRPTVETSELPQIPDRFITQQVSAQAAFVVEAVNDELDFEDEIERQDEIFIRRRIVIQLERLDKFLDKVKNRYKNVVRTIPEQINAYKSTIQSNIISLDNPEIDKETIIVNIYRRVLPLLPQLKFQFSKDQDKDFQLDIIDAELRECIARLAKMIKVSKENEASE